MACGGTIFRRTTPHGKSLYRTLFLARSIGYFGEWCGREDSNFHGLSPTAPSTLRVYLFRHDRSRPLFVPIRSGDVQYLFAFLVDCRLRDRVSLALCPRR